MNYGLVFTGKPISNGVQISIKKSNKTIVMFFDTMEAKEQFISAFEQSKN